MPAPTEAPTGMARLDRGTAFGDHRPRGLFEVPAPPPWIWESPEFRSERAARPDAEPPPEAIAHDEALASARLPLYRFFASIFGLVEVVGAITILFVGFQLIGTNWAAARSQHALRRDFARRLSAQPPVGVAGAAALVPGGAVAVIRIPRIGVNEVVVEGTSVADLMKGPGHYPGTALPGQAGNAAIAGHRTTYGAPFFHLDQVVPGDDIQVTTLSGSFHYRVSSKPRAVVPSDTAVLNPTHDNRLTLTTCTPAFSASHRLVVVAELDPGEPPLPAPPSLVGGTQIGPVPDGSVGLSGDVHAWPSALLWGMVVIAAGWAAREWGRRWHRVPVYLLASPFVALFLFAFFENVNRLLPANL
jgi:sortase A